MFPVNPQAPGFLPVFSPYYGSSPGPQSLPAQQPALVVQMLLQQVLFGLQQLAGGWLSALQAQQGAPPFPGAGGPLAGAGAGGALYGSPAPGGGALYGPPSASGGGLYGGTTTSALVPPGPSDPQDFASYLQAQRLGGTLEGKTGIAQKDAIPGTRFGRVADPTAWNADVARNYAYQFAAFATGANPLTPEGLAAGQRSFPSMSPDAQLFTQVASVFKGNLLGGPGFYNNPGLKQLLLSRGLTDLANQAGVGETDVQSIGAITQALNRGALTLQDVINSGTIDHLDRYGQVISYVQNGQFSRDLQFYDSVAL